MDRETLKQKIAEAIIEKNREWEEAGKWPGNHSVRFADAVLSAIEAANCTVVPNDLLQAQEWKPIESAPRDLPEGTPLIFSNASRDLTFVEWCENGADENGNHWSGFVEMDGTALDDDYKPTCFFALPLPPQSIEKAEG